MTTAIAATRTASAPPTPFARSEGRQKLSMAWIPSLQSIALSAVARVHVKRQSERPTKMVGFRRASEQKTRPSAERCKHFILRVIFACPPGNARVNSGDIGKFVGIHNFKRSIVEFDNSFLTQISKDSINVDIAEAGRVTDVLLRQRQMHFFDAMVRPSHPEADKKLE